MFIVIVKIDLFFIYMYNNLPWEILIPDTDYIGRIPFL